ERRDRASSVAGRRRPELGLANDCRGLLAGSAQDLLRLRLGARQSLRRIGRRRLGVSCCLGGRERAGSESGLTAQALVLLDVGGQLLRHEVEERVDVTLVVATEGEAELLLLHVHRRETRSRMALSAEPDGFGLLLLLPHGPPHLAPER